MAAGHGQIRDARRRRHALPVPAGIPGPNLRALETALQPPDRMFDPGRRRSLALPLGPIRPAIARLLALAPLRRDLPVNFETFPLGADLLSVAALHGADVEAVGMPASPAPHFTDGGGIGCSFRMLAPAALRAGASGSRGNPACFRARSPLPSRLSCCLVCKGLSRRAVGKASKRCSSSGRKSVSASVLEGGACLRFRTAGRGFEVRMPLRAGAAPVRDRPAATAGAAGRLGFDRMTCRGC